MGTIGLAANDPILKRAESVTSSTMVEVGFIPNDEHGCKIYARKDRNRVELIGIHSRSYGCEKIPVEDSVIILDFDSK